MIKITIPEIPIPKGRPRFTRQGFAFTPTKTRQYEKLVKQIALQHRPKELLTGALKVTMLFYVPIPGSWSVIKKYKAVTGEIRPITRPDLDNYAKVKDALKGVIFSDDSIIVEEHLHKWYSKEPKTIIVIEEVDG